MTFQQSFNNLITKIENNFSYLKNRIDNIVAATVDQIFDGTSTNAQSGIAIETELIKKANSNNAVFWSNSSSPKLYAWIHHLAHTIYYTDSDTPALADKIYDKYRNRAKDANSYDAWVYEYDSTNNKIKLKWSNSYDSTSGFILSGYYDRCPDYDIPNILYDTNGEKIVIGSDNIYPGFIFGKYIQNRQTIVNSGTSLKNSSGQNLEFTLSHLPEDDCSYLVLLEGRVLTGTTSGNYAPLYVESDICGMTSLCRMRTRTNSNMTSCGSVWLPVGSSRKIYVQRNSDWNGTVDGLYMNGYIKMRMID